MPAFRMAVSATVAVEIEAADSEEAWARARAMLDYIREHLNATADAAGAVTWRSTDAGVSFCSPKRD